VWDEGRGLHGGGRVGAREWEGRGFAVVGEGRWGREAVDGTWVVVGECCASSSVGAAWRVLRAW